MKNPASPGDFLIKIHPLNLEFLNKAKNSKNPKELVRNTAYSVRYNLHSRSVPLTLYLVRFYIKYEQHGRPGLKLSTILDNKNITLQIEI